VQTLFQSIVNGTMSPETHVWWSQVLKQSERQRLDILMGLACTDPTLCHLFVVERSPYILQLFNFSVETQRWLRTLTPINLEDMATIIAMEPPGMPPILQN
jgi:hypothetical protein